MPARIARVVAVEKSSASGRARRLPPGEGTPMPPTCSGAARRERAREKDARPPLDRRSAVINAIFGFTVCDPLTRGSSPSRSGRSARLPARDRVMPWTRDEPTKAGSPSPPLRREEPLRGAEKLGAGAGAAAVLPSPWKCVRVGNVDRHATCELWFRTELPFRSMPTSAICQVL